MKRRTSLGLVALFTALALILTINLEFERIKVDVRRAQTVMMTESPWRNALQGLPHGIVESASDLELKSLWQSSSSDSRFLLENCSIILFHYDGNVDGWRDLEWNGKAIHVVARNQTKWWFAKRFLHPDVVSVYDYIFLWDEDLGMENFHLDRYLRLMSSEGLEISQPALDPHHSVDIRHRITVQNRMKKVQGFFMQWVYDHRGNLKCSEESKGPPCTGWIEGMAPVFSRSAWQCVWHLIQNDLVHGWGLDMKQGYCAQGDRTKKVGVIDTEFIVHKGIPTLGGSSKMKNPRSLDLQTDIRRQSTSELKTFKERWNKAVKEDGE